MKLTVAAKTSVDDPIALSETKQRLEIIDAGEQVARKAGVEERRRRAADEHARRGLVAGQQGEAEVVHREEAREHTAFSRHHDQVPEVGFSIGIAIHDLVEGAARHVEKAEDQPAQ